MTKPASAASSSHWDVKVWISREATDYHRIEVGPIHWPDDWDTWVEIDGVRHEIPSGKRAEIEPDEFRLRTLVR